MKNRKREICTSGTVRDEDGNILIYSATIGRPQPEFIKTKSATAASRRSAAQAARSRARVTETRMVNASGGDPYRRYGPNKNGIPLGWKTLARNKRSITLNLADPQGLMLFKELTKAADVVVQSFRPETVKRYGLTYEALSAVNPRVIVVLVSGFGQFGPYAERPGFGTLAEAMSGYAAVTGQPNGPPTLPSFALADSIAALYGAMGTLNALYWRDALGGGVISEHTGRPSPSITTARIICRRSGR